MEATKSQLLADWDRLATTALERADALLNATDLGHQSEPTFWVRLSALTVMCRTVNHFAALRLLLENEFIVEARTLVRCCYENLFWMGGLKEDGPAFLEKMEADNVHSKRALGRELLKWWKKHGQSDETLAKLEAFLAEVNDKPGKKIGNQEAALAAGLGSAYTLYRVLSGDAAHPSAVSLSRHTRNEENGSLTVSAPTIWTDSTEDAETMEFACTALLSVCIAMNEIVGNEKDPVFTQLAREHGRLSDLGRGLARAD